MRKERNLILARAIFVSTTLFLLAGFPSVAQEKPKPEVFQAQAMGQGRQLGHTFNVTVYVSEYSTPEERQVLVEAFEKAGSEGLLNALSKMPSKGRIAITGTLGYDVSFIRQIPTSNGRKIRVLTNRPITFGENWTSSRSTNYNLSALEFDLVSEKDKSSGVLLPVCQFQIDKKSQELVIENYRDPWKLVNVTDRSNE